MGHCLFFLPMGPLQAETAVVGSQEGITCGSIGMITTGQEPVVDGFRPALIPYTFLIHIIKGPSTYEAFLSDHPQQSMVLMRCGLPRSPRGLVWHQSSIGNMPLEDAVDGSMSQTHVTSNSTLPHALKGKCKHFMPNTYRGWMGHYEYNQWELRKQICNCWFKLATVPS